MYSMTICNTVIIIAMVLFCCIYSSHTVITLSRDQCREINRGLKDILVRSAAELHRGLGWAKTAGCGNCQTPKRKARP